MIKKVFVVESDKCPETVEFEINELWQDMDLGNDYFYYPWFWETYFEDETPMGERYPNILEFLYDNGVNKGEEILIHHSW